MSYDKDEREGEINYVFRPCGRCRHGYRESSRRPLPSLLLRSGLLVQRSTAELAAQEREGGRENSAVLSAVRGSSRSFSATSKTVYLFLHVFQHNSFSSSRPRRKRRQRERERKLSGEATFVSSPLFLDRSWLSAKRCLSVSRKSRLEPK